MALRFLNQQARNVSTVWIRTTSSKGIERFLIQRSPKNYGKHEISCMTYIHTTVGSGNKGFNQMSSKERRGIWISLIAAAGAVYFWWNSTQKSLQEFKTNYLEAAENDSREEKDETKIFNDPIHGPMEFNPLLMKIIDTPQFQRLRDIKQLGGNYYVYPAACHNRFEHSLGVCHLAGEFVKSLQSNQPELGINSRDVLCVQIAGLCHDLGHGPLSHFFDQVFIPRYNSEWKHEDASIKMFEHLIDDNKLKPLFLEYGLDDNDVTFIKELIKGKKKTCRPQDKHFLYEIVANSVNGIDVDKWDYFARDCHSLGLTSNFDHHRFMKLARVIKDKHGCTHICSRDKEVLNIYEMFQTRTTLHKKAYQHKTKLAIESMINEALVLANEHILLKGTNDRSVKMSEAINDMVAYTNLTDSIISMIMISTDENLKEAQDLLKRVKKRDIYKHVGIIPLPVTAMGVKQASEEEKKQFKQEIVKQKIKLSDTTQSPLDEQDLIFTTTSFSYGKGNKNPIEMVYFYAKDKPDEAFHFSKSAMKSLCPPVIEEKFLYLYCKSADRQEIAKRCFEEWYKDKGLTPERKYV
jgi:HD superfamily phosphohydrolase